MHNNFVTLNNINIRYLTKYGQYEVNSDFINDKDIINKTSKKNRINREITVEPT